jgi:hypothetical protein
MFQTVRFLVRPHPIEPQQIGKESLGEKVSPDDLFCDRPAIRCKMNFFAPIDGDVAFARQALQGRKYGRWRHARFRSDPRRYDWFGFFRELIDRFQVVL